MHRAVPPPFDRISDKTPAVGRRWYGQKGSGRSRDPNLQHTTDSAQTCCKPFRGIAFVTELAAAGGIIVLDRRTTQMVCNAYKSSDFRKWPRRHFRREGAMSDVTLFHWEPNANSGKPMLALMEKGVAFHSHYLDLLNFDQHRPDYLAINPQGTIPAMTHGSRVLTESTAIMEYVDEAFPGPSLAPKHPQDRWRMRWWMKWMDQWLGPSFS